MITAADVEFHERDADPVWTETTYLAFHVPDAALMGTLYVLARPNLGVALSSVVIARGMRASAHEIDFCDPQIHLPCPPSYSDFSLANGLSVRATSLTEWDFAYRHRLGYCDLELHLEGLHHPFDPLDLAQNPTAAAKASSDHKIGDAWSHGHFDLKGKVTGVLNLHGERYDVECYDGMDRSWGPRNETPDRATCYVSANFSDELTAWLTMTLDVRDPDHIAYDRLNSGFVVAHGRVVPIVSAQVEAVSVGMLAMSDRIRLTDADGRDYELFGSVIGTRPLGSFNPSIAAFLSLMRYTWGDKVGYGGHGKLFGLAYLNRLLSSDGNASPAKEPTHA